MRNGSVLVVVAVVLTLIAVAMAPPGNSVSKNGCTGCHGNSYYQYIDILEGDANNTIPSTLNASERLQVTVAVEHRCNALTYNLMHDLTVTLTSQNNRFSAEVPAFVIGAVAAGKYFACWNITAKSTGTDTMIITATGGNDHYAGTYSDSYNPSPQISVDKPFVNTVPIIALGGPPQGVKLTGESYCQVDWTSSDDDKSGCRVSLFFSTDNFTSQNVTVATKVPNTGSYSWKLPRIDSSSVRLKADINDTYWAQNSSLSPLFTIDSTPPAVINVTPAIDYDKVSDVTVMSVEFSEPVLTSSAQSSFSISPNPGNIQWTWNTGRTLMSAVHDPFEANSSYYCTVGPGIEDLSNPGNVNSSVFSWSFSTTAVIIPQPVLLLISPNGGERNYQGEKIDVDWNASGGTGALCVNINFSAAGKYPWTRIASDRAANGTFQYTAPALTSDECKVQLTVIDESGIEAVATSRAFSIAPPLLLNATFPQNDTYYDNDTVNISYAATGGAGNVSVTVMLNNQTVGSANQKPGMFWYTVPAINATNQTLTVNATDEWGTSVRMSSHPFEIKMRVMPPLPPKIPNHPPMVVFQVVQTRVIEKEIVTFDAGAASDPDKNVLTFIWDFGDGTDLQKTSETKLPHVYISPGKYTVQLTVSDGQDNSTQSYELWVDPVAKTAPRQKNDWPLVWLGLLVVISGTVCVVYAGMSTGERRPNIRAGAQLKHTRIFVDRKKCNVCGRCARECKTGAVILTDDFVDTILDKCTACGACVPVCPRQARAFINPEDGNK